MSPLLMPILIIHVVAVVAKLAIFIIIPRLRDVDHVRSFLAKYRQFERVADWILWLTGALLVYFSSWKLLTQAWMIVSLVLYALVFLAIRFALMKELEKVAESKKLMATSELARLRTNNWCVGILAVVFLAIIAYLMMVKP